MSEDGPDIERWRTGISRLHAPEIRAALLVQCDLHWLCQEATDLRNEIDDAVMSAQLARPELRIDRFVLHSLPIAGGLNGSGAPTAAELTAAHEEWMYRLSASTALLCPEDQTAPRVHRIIVQGNQPSVEVPDMVELCEGGVWSSPAAAHALGLLARNGVTTPLTRYDVNLDGPYGDADPSVYL